MVAQPWRDKGAPRRGWSQFVLRVVGSRKQRGLSRLSQFAVGPRLLRSTAAETPSEYYRAPQSRMCKMAELLQKRLRLQCCRELCS